MKTLKINPSMDKAGIEAAIKSITNRGESLDKDIQYTGLSVLAHIAEHKEVSLFVKLYNALPKGSRTNALVAWALAFGQVAVNLDKASKKDRPFLFLADKITDLKGAADKPWFDFKKPKDVSDEFDFSAEVAAFQAKLSNWIKAGKVSPTDHLAVGILSVKPVGEAGPTEPVEA